MLHFDVAEIVQARLPVRVLREIVGYALRQQDVPGVGTIHDALRRVHPGAGDVRAIVHIRHRIDRSAVNSHPHADMRMVV